MSDRDALTAVVRVSQEDQLGATMKRLRIWLDSEKIEPREFRTATDTKGYTFTIAFRNLQDAERFRTEFGVLSAL